MPRPYDHRQRLVSGAYWVCEIWTPCDCPNCDELYHWQSHMGGPKEFVTHPAYP